MILRCGWTGGEIRVPEVCLNAIAFFLAESDRTWRFLVPTADGGRRWLTRPV